MAPKMGPVIIKMTPTSFMTRVLTVTRGYALLKLISRFEITADQMASIYLQEEHTKVGIDCTDADILSNPCLLYEATRLTADPISVWTVDRGVFPDALIRENHPLPEPTALDAGTGARRVRALSVSVLEETAERR